MTDIRKLRARLDLTQLQFGKIIRTGRSNISQWECASIPLPRYIAESIEVLALITPFLEQSQTMRNSAIRHGLAHAVDLALKHNLLIEVSQKK